MRLTNLRRELLEIDRAAVRLPQRVILEHRPLPGLGERAVLVVSAAEQRLDLCRSECVTVAMFSEI